MKIQNDYDYDKSIRKQTNDLQNLNAQLAALEGINTLEANAKRRKLQVEISEKQEDLDDTVREHMFEMSKDALDDLKEALQDAFDDKWEKVGYDVKRIADLMSAANVLSQESAATINSTLTSLLKYYGIDAAETGIDKAFASGTPSVTHKLKGLIGEKGSEIATTKKGLIVTLDKGDGVISHEMTENLMNMAKGITPILNTQPNRMEGYQNHVVNETNIDQHYDSLIHIDGSADAATVEDIKKMTNDLLDKSYKYTSKKIHDGYMKSGGRRIV